MLFPLGRIVITAGTVALLQANEAVRLLKAVRLLNRHLNGDWGELDAHDWHANSLALREGHRLLRNNGFHGARVWIITEADRTVTTILLPE
jgi:hypothetical protein